MSFHPQHADMLTKKNQLHTSLFLISSRALEKKQTQHQYIVNSFMVFIIFQSFLSQQNTGTN